MNWCVTVCIYSLPLLPLASRSVMCLCFHTQMATKLSESERDTESHYTHLLTLAGFSFSGLIALIVLDASLRFNLRIAIYYLLISFLGYLLSLNIQGYKFTRRADEFATGVMECATLSLVLSVVATLFAAELGASFTIALSIIALSVWLIDHIWRLKLKWSFYKDLVKETNETRKATS